MVVKQPLSVLQHVGMRKIKKLPLFILQHIGMRKSKTIWPSLFHGYVKHIESIIPNLAVKQVIGFLEVRK
jgi:hypothetical protein